MFCLYCKVASNNWLHWHWRDDMQIETGTVMCLKNVGKLFWKGSVGCYLVIFVAFLPHWFCLPMSVPMTLNFTSLTFILLGGTIAVPYLGPLVLMFWIFGKLAFPLTATFQWMVIHLHVLSTDPDHGCPDEKLFKLCTDHIFWPQYFIQANWLLM